MCVFVAGGLADLSMKTFEAEFANGASRPVFMLMIFGTALAVGLGCVAWRHPVHRVRPATLLLGAGLGIANLGAVEFILRALGSLPGTFVFPVNNAAVVMMIALLGVLIWQERLSAAGWTGILLAAVSVALLGTGVSP